MRLAQMLTLALASVSVPAWGGESAVLANGFRLHADRHEMSGDNVRLISGGGYTELPASQVAAFEPDEAPASPSPVVTPPRAAAPIAAVPVLTTASASQPAVHQPAIQQLDPKRLAADAARQSNLPEALIRSIMHWESGFRPDAVSPKGAIGLMQLMPGTAQQLHADPYNPKQNVEAGAAYLRSLLLKYESSQDQVARAVAAYNAGPGAVDRYNGIPPYRETRDYVIRVLTEYSQSLTQPAATQPAVGGQAGGR
jgi:soluble lytic murein transglycosylase-like protein